MAINKILLKLASFAASFAAGLIATYGLGAVLASVTTRAYIDSFRMKEEYQGLVLDTGGLAALLVNLHERSGWFHVTSLNIASQTQLLRRTFQPDDPGHVAASFVRYHVQFGGQDDRGASIDTILSPTSRLIEFAAGCALSFAIAMTLLIHFVDAFLNGRTELRISKAMSRWGLQVAHDIRSPVAAVRTIVANANLEPRERQILVRATGRIIEIAESLLEASKRSRPIDPKSAKASLAPNDDVTERRSCKILPAIEQSLDEKRHEFSSFAGLTVSLNAGSDFGHLVAAIDETALQRVLSNLVNNAVEAMSGRGEIKVSLSRQDTFIVTRVADNGPGMPADVLRRLGEAGNTSGKIRGNGLGLAHAKETIERCGGSFEVKGTSSSGTVIEFTLPLISGPSSVGTLILVDDDVWVRDAWEHAAAQRGMALTTFDSPAALLASIDEIARDATFYLDCELNDERYDGRLLARHLHEQGFGKLHLTTGHDSLDLTNEPWIRSVVGKEFPLA